MTSSHLSLPPDFLLAPSTIIPSSQSPLARRTMRAVTITAQTAAKFLTPLPPSTNTHSPLLAPKNPLAYASITDCALPAITGRLIVTKKEDIEREKLLKLAKEIVFAQHFPRTAIRQFKDHLLNSFRFLHQHALSIPLEARQQHLDLFCQKMMQDINELSSSSSTAPILRLRKEILLSLCRLIAVYDGRLPFHNVDHSLGVAQGAYALTEGLSHYPTPDASFREITYLAGIYHDMLTCFFNDPDLGRRMAGHHPEKSEGASAAVAAGWLPKDAPPLWATILRQNILATVPRFDSELKTVLNDSFPSSLRGNWVEEAHTILTSWPVALSDLEASIVNSKHWATIETDCLFFEMNPAAARHLEAYINDKVPTPDTMAALKKYLHHLYQQRSFAKGQASRLQHSLTHLNTTLTHLNESPLKQALTLFRDNFNKRYCSAPHVIKEDGYTEITSRWKEIIALIHPSLKQQALDVKLQEFLENPPDSLLSSLVPQWHKNVCSRLGIHRLPTIAECHKLHERAPILFN